MQNPTSQDPRKNNVWFDTSSMTAYFEDYKKNLAQALSTVDNKQIEKAIEIMKTVSQREGIFYVCGNGGSAAIANHLCCDWTKGTFVENRPRLRTMSLNANVPMLTAVSNDFGNDSAFAYQLKIMAKSIDALFVISSSGNSPNIVKTLEMAKSLNIPSIALTGFSGGVCKDIADVCVHVNFANYAIVEDSHQAIMQALAQYFFASQEK